MRKFVISLVAAGSALAFASPAAAQYYPQQQPYGYNGYGAQPYGYNGYNGYGYNGYGQIRALQARIDALQSRIRYMGGRNSAERLREESRNLEWRLRTASRNGLNPYELNDIQRRIARLEQRVNYAMANRYGRYGGYGYGYNSYNQGYYGDRDHGDHDGDRNYDRDDDGHDHDD